jgi:hypothetical protein
MKYLLGQMEERLKNTEVYVICQTLSVNPGQYDFIPKSAQFSDVENLDYRLGQIIETQKERMKAYREAHGGKMDIPKLYDGDKGCDSDDDAPGCMKQTSMSRQAAMKEIDDPDAFSDEQCKPVLIIMDDCVNENAVRTSKNLSLLAIGGRHILISCIILSQVVAGSASVPPSVRTQADTVIVVAQPRSRNERDLIAEQYLTAGNEAGSKASGLMLMNKITEEPHRALVISTVSASARSYPDYCFKVGPCPFPPVPDGFRLGTEEQWNYEMRKKKAKGSKEMPNPFTAKPDLPKNMRTGEYFRATSDDLFW